MEQVIGIYFYLFYIAMILEYMEKYIGIYVTYTYIQKFSICKEMLQISGKGWVVHYCVGNTGYSSEENVSISCLWALYQVHGLSYKCLVD